MPGRDRVGWKSWMVTFLVGSVGGMAALAGIVVAHYGSVATAAHAWRGDVLLCDRYEARVERQPAGQVVAFRLTNRSAQAVRLVGSQSSCTCVMATGLPRSIDPGATITLEVRYQPKPQVASRREVVRVFTDQPGQKTLALAIVAKPTRGANG